MEFATLLTPLLLQLLKDAPELASKIHEFLQKPNPTPQDWQNFWLELAQEDYFNYVTASTLPHGGTDPVAVNLAVPQVTSQLVGANLVPTLTGMHLGISAGLAGEAKPTPYAISVLFPHAIGRSQTIKMVKGWPAGCRIIADAPGSAHVAFDMVIDETIAISPQPCAFTIVEVGGKGLNLENCGAKVGDYIWGAKKFVVLCDCYRVGSLS